MDYKKLSKVADSKIVDTEELSLVKLYNKIKDLILDDLGRPASFDTLGGQNESISEFTKKKNTLNFGVASSTEEQQKELEESIKDFVNQYEGFDVEFEEQFIPEIGHFWASVTLKSKGQEQEPSSGKIIKTEKDFINALSKEVKDLNASFDDWEEHNGYCYVYINEGSNDLENLSEEIESRVSGWAEVNLTPNGIVVSSKDELY